MKGCALGALLSALGLAAIIGAVGAGLHRWYGVALTDVPGVAIFGGLFGWIAVNLLISAVNAWRERGALLAGLAGTTPRDGRRTVLVGHIEPSGAVLRAPLSGRECVAYTFEIWEMRHSGSRQTRVVLCDGLAVTPSVIITRGGSFRLLAVPELDCDTADLDRESALPRAAELMRTIPVEPSKTPAPAWSGA